MLLNDRFVSFLKTNWCPIALACLSFYVSFVFLRFGLGDEPTMFKPAVDVAEGKVLYKETYTQYGGVTVLIQAIFLLIFGKTVVAMKVSTAVFTAMTIAIQEVVWRRFIPEWLSALCVFSWIFLNYYFEHPYMAWPNIYATFFQMLSLYLLIRWLEADRQSYRLLFLAGASLGLSFLSKQPYGLIFLFGAALYFGYVASYENHIKRQVARYAVFCSGGLLTVALFVAWAFQYDALHDFWLQSIVYASKHTSTYGSNNSLITIVQHLFYIDHRWPAKNNPYILMYLCLYLINLIVFIFLTNKFLVNAKCIKLKDLVIILTSIFSLLSWLQNFPNPGILHQYQAATPMLGIAAYFVLHFSKAILVRISIQSSIMRNLTILIIMISLLTPGLTYHARRGLGLYLTYSNPKSHTTLNRSALKGMIVPNERAKYYLNVFDMFVRNQELISDKVLIDLSESKGMMAMLARDIKNFHPMWNGNSKVINMIYPFYIFERNDYIKSECPFLLSKADSLDHFKSFNQGYKIIDEAEDLALMGCQK